MARLQAPQKLDDLRLHRTVERAGRLIQHDEARLQHHGAGDRDALTLPAREFMWIAFERALRQADLLQHGHHPVVALGAGELAENGRAGPRR